MRKYGIEGRDHKRGWAMKGDYESAYVHFQLSALIVPALPALVHSSTLVTSWSSGEIFSSVKQSIISAQIKDVKLVFQIMQCGFLKRVPVVYNKFYMAGNSHRIY